MINRKYSLISITFVFKEKVLFLAQTPSYWAWHDSSAATLHDEDLLSCHPPLLVVFTLIIHQAQLQAVTLQGRTDRAATLVKLSPVKAPGVDHTIYPGLLLKQIGPRTGDNSVVLPLSLFLSGIDMMGSLQH